MTIKNTSQHYDLALQQLIDVPLGISPKDYHRLKNKSELWYMKKIVSLERQLKKRTHKLQRL